MPNTQQVKIRIFIVPCSFTSANFVCPSLFPTAIGGEKMGGGRGGIGGEKEQQHTGNCFDVKQNT